MQRGRAAARAGRRARLATSLLALALAVPVLAASCGAGANPPNILLLTVDTLRADHLEPYGYERPTSPFLARFADSATVFEAAQAQSSWTLPSLATLMTGTYPSHHGATHYTSRVESSYTTLPERLRSAGYDTAAVANHVFLARSYGFHQGFTHYDDGLVRAAEEGGMHRTVTSDQVTDRALGFLEAKSAARRAGADDTPWLLWAHYFDPHNEYLFHDGTSEPFAATEEGEDRDLYDGEIAYTDRALGRLLERLDELGFRDDTIVVLVADHGEAFGEHGRYQHAETLYEELIDVPLIVRAPGFEPRRVAEPVQVADVPPTLLELCGLPLPADVDGRSLVPAMRGERLPQRPVVAEVTAGAYEPGAPPPPKGEAPLTQIRSLTLGRWKLVEQETGAVELYDLEADPDESENVAAERPERVTAMRERLAEIVADAERRGAGYERAPPMGHSDDELEALRALGYLEGAGP